VLQNSKRQKKEILLFLDGNWRGQGECNNVKEGGIKKD
jgi:hypothetical protein